MSDHVPTFSDLTNAWLVWRDISVKDASQEIQNHIDSNRGDAWDEGWSEGFGNARDEFDALSIDDNPYRKQQEA